MKIRKYLAVFLLLVTAVLILCSCGGKDKQTDTTDQTQTDDSGTTSGQSDENGEYTLNYKVTPSAGGKIEGEAKQKLKPGEKSSEVTAAANKGYKFIKWSDGKTEAVRKGDTIKSNTTITAQFASTNSFTLNYTCDSKCGSISGEASQQLGTDQKSTKVTANANNGYKFVKWSDGKTEAEREGDVISADTTITAEFDFVTYTLTYAVDSSDHGSISGETKQGLTIDSGSTAVTAQAKSGYTFVKWSDGKTEATRKGDKISADTKITAIFKTAGVTITYNIKTEGGGKIVGSASQTLAAGQKTSSVTAFANGGYVFYKWSDGSYLNPRSGDSANVDTTISAIFHKITVPNFYITTSTGSPITNKNSYIGATFSITGADKSNDNITKVSGQIKGRGNSSWSGAPQNEYDSKNSYHIKLNEQAQLLGLGESKNKDWVLQADKFDISMMRNWAAWRMGELFENISYSTECAWVNLYVNGEYRGAYQLCELIEAANDRVEVDDSGTEPDTGYLIELDMRGNSEGRESVDYFYVKGFMENESNKREFVVKSDANTKQVAFIKSYVQSCHDAIMTGDRNKISQLIDIPSFIDMFIIEELTKDCDVGTASFFMSKPKGGKLYLTAPWDFDFGMGTYGPGEEPDDDLVTNMDYGPNPWFISLMKTSWFKEEVAARLKQCDGRFDQMINELKQIGAALKPAADKNDQKWYVYGEHFHPYVSSQVSSHLNSYQEHINFLVKWLNTRWDFLNDYFSPYI